MSKFIKFALITALLSSNVFAGDITSGVVQGVVAGAIVSDSIDSANKRANKPAPVVTSGNAIRCSHLVDNGCVVELEPAGGGMSHNYAEGRSMHVSLTFAEYVSYISHVPLSKVKVTKITWLQGAALIEYEVL